MGALNRKTTPPRFEPRRMPGKIVSLNTDPVLNIVERRVVARLHSDIEEAFLNDCWLGEMSTAATASNERQEAITLDSLREVLEQFDEIQRRSPFQFSKFMAADAEHAVRCQGKLYFGRKRWDEFRAAERRGESTLIAWLMGIKILDLDAMARRYGYE